MNYSRKTIAKNAGVMMASQLITWALALLLTVFLPRYLGPEAIGKFTLASSLWAVLSIAVNFGMDTLLTKEIAREPQKTDAYLTTSVVLRVAIYGVCVLLMAGYVRIAGYSSETIQVVNIMGLATLVWQIASAFGAVLQGIEHMEFISISDIAAKFFSTVISIGALLLGYHVIVIAWINVFTSVVAGVIMALGLKRVRGLRPVFEKDLIGWILKSSFPYLMVTGFLVAYNQIDVIIISLLINETEIGWYSAANRLFGTFLFIPTVLITALFPVLSRAHVADSELLHKLLNKGIEISLLLGIPIGLGIVAISNPLVVLLYGANFSPAGPILAVLGVVLITTYLNSLLGKYFVSVDRQTLWAWVMAGAALLTIPLDLVLVPLCEKQFGIGALGGSFSYLITESVMMIVGLYFLPKGILGWKNLWFTLRVLAAGLVMAGVAWALRNTFILIPILAGAGVYAGLALLTGIISAQDRQLALDLYAKVRARLRGKTLESI